MKLISAALVAGVALVAGLVSGCPAQAATVTVPDLPVDNPAVFFIPHQDDETLTLAADIYAHVKAGRSVMLVMMTKGDASGVLPKFQAGPYPTMTAAEFDAARDREFVAAVRHLGVPSYRIRWAGLQDGTLTQAEAQPVIDAWMNRYPKGSFKTLYWQDDHPDHRAISYAMRSHCQVSHSDCRFFQFRRYWTKYPAPGWYVPGYSAPAVLAAANEYRLLNPSIGRYAIGSQSVPRDFDAIKLDPRSKGIITW